MSRCLTPVHDLNTKRTKVAKEECPAIDWLDAAGGPVGTRDSAVFGAA